MSVGIVFEINGTLHPPFHQVVLSKNRTNQSEEVRLARIIRIQSMRLAQESVGFWICERHLASRPEIGFRVIWSKLQGLPYRFLRLLGQTFREERSSQYEVTPRLLRIESNRLLTQIDGRVHPKRFAVKAYGPFDVGIGKADVSQREFWILVERLFKEQDCLFIVLFVT